VAYDLGRRKAPGPGGSRGDLTEGCAADFVVLDASAIEAWTPPVNALVYRGSDAWVQATSGRPPRLRRFAVASGDRARIELAKVAGRVVP